MFMPRYNKDTTSFQLRLNVRAVSRALSETGLNQPKLKKHISPTFERTLFHHPTRTIGCSFMSVRPLPTFCWVGYGQNVILELFVN